MLNTRDDDGGLSDFKYYYYTPAMAGAIIFVLLFFVATVIHFWQMFRTRTWFMIPFCIGGLCKSVSFRRRYLLLTIEQSRLLATSAEPRRPTKPPTSRSAPTLSRASSFWLHPRSSLHRSTWSLLESSSWSKPTTLSSFAEPG